MDLKIVSVDENFYSIFKDFVDLSEPSYLYLLKFDNKTIGYGKIDKENNRKKNILDMYILEEYRGNGYGKIFFKKLLDEAKNIGYKDITFYINSSNIINRKLIVDNSGVKISQDGNISKYIIPLGN